MLIFFLSCERDIFPNFDLLPIAVPPKSKKKRKRSSQRQADDGEGDEEVKAPSKKHKPEANSASGASSDVQANVQMLAGVVTEAENEAPKPPADDDSSILSVLFKKDGLEVCTALPP